MQPSERNRKEYIGRILRVQDHVERHLADELTLEELAGVACFSPYHFHRIWSSLTGEPLGQFIQRLRLQKAAALLLQNTDEAVLNIALECGFSGAAVFARAFQGRYGMSASAWRAGGGERYLAEKSKERKAERKQGKAAREGIGYPEDMHDVHDENFRRLTMQEMKQAEAVRIADDAAMTVAYIRHTGPYAGNAELFGGLIGKLCAWAGPRGFLGPEGKLLTIYHDSPELVDADKLRISVCCAVPPGTRPEGEFGVMEVPGGKNAHALYELGTDEYGAAWAWLGGKWLPESGWQMDDRYCYELYLGGPEERPEGKCRLEIVIPVKPL